MSASDISEVVSFGERCLDYLADYVPFYKKECFVAGGFFPRFYHSLPIRDIDVFVSKKYYSEIIKEYKSVNFKHIVKGKEIFNRFEVDNILIDVIGFHNPRNKNYIDTFDFTICQTTLFEKYFFSPISIFYAIKKKQLKINPIAKFYNTKQNSIARLIKYLNLGFTISDEQLSNLYFAINKATLKNTIYKP